MQVSPLSGQKNVTTFTFEIDPPVANPFINWGDGTFSFTNTATHTYDTFGIYNVFGGGCSATSAFSLSVYNGAFFADTLTVTRDAVSSVVSCPYTFNINLSSESQINTVVLYASGSQSSPYQQTRNFWSHLNPEWEFLFNGEQISELEIVGTPIYQGSNLLGYSATSAVQFKDDMPGNPNLFFTMVKKEADIPMNSRVYATVSHSICAVDPDILYITADGINPINSIQWSDRKVPYVISVGSTQLSCSNILHYVSGDVLGFDFRAGCYGMNMSAFQYSQETIKPFDQDNFPTGGYVLTNFFFPGSALADVQITNNLDACQNNYDQLEFQKTRKTPQHVVLSASGNFSYDGKSFSLSGASNPFDLLAFENRHSFYRKGEDYTVYDILKTSLPFDVEQTPNFNLYLSAVAGEGDTLGKIYDKIANFTNDHADVDICTFDALINKAAQFDSEIDDFGIEFPEELKRLFNFATIPLQKLIGTRCVCNTNFVNCKGCATSNVCTICKFDKRSNLGEEITFGEYISAGETILYKEAGGKYFSFLPVQAQATDVFKLGALSAEPMYSKGLTNFCFYRWISTPQNNPVESVVNYKDPRNLLNPGLSSNADWYGENGIVEEMFNYVLTKNLLKD